MNFSVATNERWTKDGERQERTTWHRCVAWGPQAKLAAKYLQKGSKVTVEGRLRVRNYDTTVDFSADGKTFKVPVQRTVVEIVVENQGLEFHGNIRSAEDQQEAVPEAPTAEMPQEEDIPF